MSSRCQCPFSGPSDTILGCHRDPIPSGKRWLTFAVRELSGVAAGKPRETVWESQCKPEWWDSVCPHPWKNPTTTPKDKKDTLNVKFECLLQHLRKVGQLPRKMEKEIDLWEADRKAEVFLMTYFSSLLGQASNLHSLVEETCRKMEKSGIPVDVSILNDLQSCLTACVDKLADKRNQREGTSKDARCAGKKRHSCKTDSDGPSHPPCKQPKHSPSASPPLSSSSTFPTLSLVQSSPAALSSAPQLTLTPSPCVWNAPVSAEQPKMAEKQATKTADATPPICQTTKTQTLPKPKAYPNLSIRAEDREKMGELGVGTDSVAVTVDTSVSMLPVLPSACLPAVDLQGSASDDIQRTHSEDYSDIFSVDIDDAEIQELLENTIFCDSLLLEPSSDNLLNVSSTAVSPCSVTQPVPSQSPASPGTALVQNDVVKHSSHDPFFGHSLSPSGQSESSPSHVDVSEAVAATDRQAESEQTEGRPGTGLCSGVGGMNRGLQDTRVVSESGYSSESCARTSHGSSWNSENNRCFESSLDLEHCLFPWL